MDVGCEKNGWGGRRSRAGRKPKGRVAGVSHATRPFHAADRPLFVTYRVRADVPGLRRAGVSEAIAESIGKAHKSWFTICEAAVFDRHVRLMIEADSTKALSRGQNGLGTRLAKTINKALGRRGRVFTDRYRADELDSPVAVRGALAAILLEHAERPRVAPGCDLRGAWHRGLPVPPLDPTRTCVSRRFTMSARTSLLIEGSRPPRVLSTMVGPAG